MSKLSMLGKMAKGATTAKKSKGSSVAAKFAAKYRGLSARDITAGMSEKEIKSAMQTAKRLQEKATDGSEHATMQSLVGRFQKALNKKPALLRMQVGSDEGRVAKQYNKGGKVPAAKKKKK